MANFRWPVAPRWSLVLAWVVCCAAATLTHVLARDDGPATSSATAGKERLREGTLLAEQFGTFKPTGDRLQFLREDGVKFVVLENLQLDRIARRIAESPDELSWSVQGVVTEFGGNNFLLITRAIQRPAATQRERQEPTRTGGVRGSE